MNIKSNMNLIYKFLIKYGYSFRTKTHIGQSMKESSLKEASYFGTKFIRIEKNMDLIVRRWKYE